MSLHLVASWGQLFGLALISLSTVSLYTRLGVLGVAGGMLTSFAFRIGYFICVDRCVRGLQALRPQGCSIYDRAFWRHERFWKLADSAYIQLFNGTPYKNLLWRLLGVRIGRRVFDDGAFLAERSFATIGDHVTLNAGCVIQCHSQEDGAFKSDHTTIGAHTTLGVGSFVHYGVVIDEHVTLDADAFLMKGEQLDAGTHWSGNPARPTHTPGHAPQATDESYVTALLARISALETKINELNPGRTSHPATKTLAGAVAVLTIVGAAATQTALPSAVPAAWRTLLAGLTPTTPSIPPIPPIPSGSTETDDAPDTPAPVPSPAVAPVQNRQHRQAPLVYRSPVSRPRPVGARPVPVVAPPVPAASPQKRAEAALKRAQAELKAAKAAQKKSKPSRGSKDSGT
jgi:carbonic anhydrase/acetyltransferase-like protein (isoleucine patch superfamily)